MEEKIYISVVELCNHYDLSQSFFEELLETELVQADYQDNFVTIHRDGLITLEKITRIHHELHINVEGIDVVFNLLERIEQMQEEMMMLRRKVGNWE